MRARREVRGQMALDLPPELTRRSEQWEERRAERAAMRAEFKEARRHGLYVRHTMKLQRLERQADAMAFTSRAFPGGPRNAGDTATTASPAVVPGQGPRAGSRNTAPRHQPATTIVSQAAEALPDRATPQPETAVKTNPRRVSRSTGEAKPAAGGQPHHRPAAHPVLRATDTYMPRAPRADRVPARPPRSRPS